MLCAPTRPPPPERFSTTNGWPNRALSASANSRAITSAAPPAANGASRRIGFSGHSAAALFAGKARSMRATNATRTFIADDSLLALVGDEHLDGVDQGRRRA